MKAANLLIGAGAIAGLLAPSISMAGETRSAAALPSAHVAANAPVSGVRADKKLKHKSNLFEGASGPYIIGAAALAATAVAVVVIADTSDKPDSPG